MIYILGPNVLASKNSWLEDILHAKSMGRLTLQGSEQFVRSKNSVKPNFNLRPSKIWESQVLKEYMYKGYEQKI